MLKTNINTVDLYTILRITVNSVSNSIYRDKLFIKGGTALMGKLLEQSRTDLFRRTTDIDIHCNTIALWESFCKDIMGILNKNDYKIDYRLIKRRVSPEKLETSDSLVFLATLSNKTFIEIKIDMNIKPNNIISVEFSPVLQMYTYDKATMLADKIVAVSSKKVYRRIKDIYDICVLSELSSYISDDIINHINLKHPNVVLTNMLVPQNEPDLVHAYDMFSGIINKPSSYDVLNRCSLFLEPIYTRRGGYLWNPKTGMWVYQ